MSRKRIYIDEMYRSDDGGASNFIGQTRDVNGKSYRVIDAWEVWSDGEDEGFTLELEAMSEGYEGELVIPEIGPDGLPVREIGFKQFMDEEDLVSVKIPDTVEDIGVYAFSGCSKLVSIEFYESKAREDESLKERKFDSSSYIDDIRKNMSVLSPNSNPLFFRWRALDYCSSLKRIVLPNRDVFFLCDVRSTKWWVLQPYGMVYLNNTLLGVNGKCESHVEIKEGTLAIAPHAFENCEQLQSVIIPSTVKHVGEFAFEGCVSLKSIVIPEGVLGIDTRAFLHCKSLESIDFPASISVLKEIGFGIDNLKTIKFHGAPPFKNGRFRDLFTDSYFLPVSDVIPKSLRVVMMHKNYFKQEMEIPDNIEVRFFEDE